MDRRGFTDDNKLSLLIWLRMVRFYQRSNQLSNDHLQHFGVTAAQFDMLAQVHIHQPVSQLELAEHLTISRGGVSHMLARLEKENLIVRDQQWKVKYISLTEKGKDLMEKVMPIQSDFQASLFDVLDDTEKKNLHEMMIKVHRYSLQTEVPNSIQEES
ncbi:MarR family winged helix-turn-helix transcriptional regulator [Peribacillus butanolivorans]|uniref:Transcriptional regulator n=1 Tax=Peribacillus butanolivorans TaxID=421767 RepID=A0AAX0S3J2_9BACI|nr:MarR family transcriptional regulator [Peribacillus butanolivorans]AXN38344.1 MarR family transcriptional regulator [Peribacillus butanolivorans]MED3690814.1 MarR family transcriptional regulator [Peribacillus butanolivorans]PEJ33307.1 transcriptional regulator [Peribacillus butanolivorans]QNU03190.1 MarR family transcriptional regulator [Peribacillus butanolivorans]